MTSKSLYAYSLSNFRAKILDALWWVHKCGISLGDLAERNVLIRDGHYMLIDFKHCKEHTCQWTFDFLRDTEGTYAHMRLRL